MKVTATNMEHCVHLRGLALSKGLSSRVLLTLARNVADTHWLVRRGFGVYNGEDHRCLVGATAAYRGKQIHSSRDAVASVIVEIGVSI